MLRPKWIGLLVLSLVVAGVFAGLGKWQLDRAIESGKAVVAPVETTLPLQQVASPGGAIPEAAIGQLVEFTAVFVPGDEQILYGRLNYDKLGYWVVSHATVESAGSRPIALAVARGWAPTREQASTIARKLAATTPISERVTGRILPDEQPAVPTNTHDLTAMNTLGVAALYNLWHGVSGVPVYSAYVVDHSAPAGLDAIYSPPPSAQVQLDWLNIFYAAEWVVFAGFAVFFWYRLVKDEKEKEDELRALLVEESLAAGEHPQGK